VTGFAGQTGFVIVAQSTSISSSPPEIMLYCPGEQGASLTTEFYQENFSSHSSILTNHTAENNN
jgi:hypothetical protein